MIDSEAASALRLEVTDLKDADKFHGNLNFGTGDNIASHHAR
jgi:hypothetical protein